jgi:hypothetical protein
MIGLMQGAPGEFTFGWADPQINNMLKSISSEEVAYTLHFNQNEEFFLKLQSPFKVPQFPIHHDVDNPEPSDSYRNAVIGLLEQILPLCPSVFEHLSYIFDPAEIFRPLFFQIYQIKKTYYLYLVQLDLRYRPSESTIVEQGDNDLSHCFQSWKLFLECNLIPLSGLTTEEGKVIGCSIEQSVSQTWIGESGRGYIVQGIWMDHDLTKFFSKLMLPSGKKSYPYYPFNCKHRSICHSVLNLSPEGRKRHLHIAVQARSFLTQHIETMQETLKRKTFSVNLPQFNQIKEQIPEYWNKIWEPLIVKPYLNEHDMKEFLVEFND